jgi:hypothetical protein
MRSGGGGGDRGRGGEAEARGSRKGSARPIVAYGNPLKLYQPSLCESINHDMELAGVNLNFHELCINLIKAWELVNQP